MNAISLFRTVDPGSIFDTISDTPRVFSRFRTVYPDRASIRADYDPHSDTISVAGRQPIFFATQTRSTGTRGRSWVHVRIPGFVKSGRCDSLTDSFKSFSSLGDLVVWVMRKVPAIDWSLMCECL